MVLRHAEAEDAVLELAADRFAFNCSQPCFIEASLDYIQPVFDGCVIVFWGKVSWLKTRVTAIRSVSEIETAEIEAQSTSGSASFRRGIVGGGVVAHISF